MATLSRGQTFGATETVTNTKLHNLVDLATITNIVDADISAGAQIQFSKILQGNVDGSLLVNLGNIASNAGYIPFANLSVPFGSTIVSLVTIPNQSLLPLTLASWVDGTSLRNLASTPVDQQLRYNTIVSSLASGSLPAYNGTNNFVGFIPAAARSVTVFQQFTLETTTSASYVVKHTFKFKKVASLNTVTVYAYMKQSSGGQTTDVRTTIGSATPLVLTSSNETTFTEHNGTIDVSGLTNGSFYDTTIELEASGGTTGSYQDLIAFGS